LIEEKPEADLLPAFLHMWSPKSPDFGLHCRSGRLSDPAKA
jgi:hypothetical protein